MSNRRGGLGRGIASLIPTTGPGSAGVRFAEIPVDAIRANPRQPRGHFDEQALQELADSIRMVGVLQPLVVRPTDDGYELVMGERRLRAARMADVAEVPALVRDTADDALLRDALLENVHRRDLNPLEEAAAFSQLLADFGVTHEELAGRLGCSRSHVTNTVRLLQLSAAVQRRVAAGVLSAGHARALLGIADHDAQERLAARIVAEGLSVRATEEAVALGEVDGPGRPRRPPRLRAADPEVQELAQRLSDVFDTRVRVDVGRAKGKLVIEFASREDLDRILAGMGVAPTGTPAPAPPAASF